MSNIKIDTDKLAEGALKLAAEARERQWKEPLRHVRNDCRIDGPACGPRSVTLERASEALAIPDGITAMIEYADTPQRNVVDIALDEYLQRLFTTRLVAALGKVARRLETDGTTLVGDRYNALTQLIADEAGIVFSREEAVKATALLNALYDGDLTFDYVLSEALNTFNGAAKLHPRSANGYTWQGLTATLVDDEVAFVAVPVTFSND